MSAHLRRSQRQAQYFEQLLRERPNDLFLRLQGLMNNPGSGKDEHVLWLVRHHPALEYAPVYWWYRSNQAELASARLWRDHLAAAPENLNLFRNAAHFYYNTDLAEVLLMRGQKLEPSEHHWAHSLCSLYRSKGKKMQALEQVEIALQCCPPEFRRCLLQWDAVSLALDCKDFQKAEALAYSLLEMVRAETSTTEFDEFDRQRGHQLAHGALGLVALARGELDEAVRRLRLTIRASWVERVQGPYGPATELALELLRQGQKETVIDFLEQWKPHWPAGQEKLAAWLDDIRFGRNPSMS